MKVAIVGSRNLSVNDLWNYLPEKVTEIVSGGAMGIDTCAREYALKHGIELKEFLPEYEKFGRSAPIKRNQQIIEYADLVLAFWDGSSRGTFNVIKTCRKMGKGIKVFLTKYSERPDFESIAVPDEL